MSSIEWLSFLILSYIFFQEELEIGLSILVLRLFVLCANTYLLIRSYLIYRKLKKGIEANGLQVPPFRFTSIDK